MIQNKQFKCVNCSENVGALYRNYGPSVLKLSKCEHCKGIVDKYIEYDPVIVMIDLVLISKEAQRHIIFNTDFKAYWKLFIILMMLETYGIWRNDSLFNIVVNSLCNIQNNSTTNTTFIKLPQQLLLNNLESYNMDCMDWAREEKDGVNLFIWEKDFYIQFISTFMGVIVFILIIHSTMRLFSIYSQDTKVGIVKLLKSYSLANTSLLFTLPTLVWGTQETLPETRLLHYLLVFLYMFTVFYNVFTVLYESPRMFTTVILLFSHLVKFIMAFHLPPLIRTVTT
ncbi:unnamed protein product [Pieris brassicae]|uniref:Protein ARV n=1 Tax=Pieris brassicae TaxID=7116 RepID=A0A9P0TQH4_PIEBR|nr:unnamed protein product [Pieris brassicae]